MASANRRDTLEILSNLLENMSEPRRLTQLLFQTNLSYTQLRKYLTMVLRMGLAKQEESKNKYYLVTTDGKFFIDMVKKRTAIKPFVS